MSRQGDISELLARWVRQHPAEAGDPTVLSNQQAYLNGLPDDQLAAILRPPLPDLPSGIGGIASGLGSAVAAAGERLGGPFGVAQGAAGAAGGLGDPGGVGGAAAATGARVPRVRLDNNGDALVPTGPGVLGPEPLPPAPEAPSPVAAGAGGREGDFYGEAPVWEQEAAWAAPPEPAPPPPELAAAAAPEEPPGPPALTGSRPPARPNAAFTEVPSGTAETYSQPEPELAAPRPSVGMNTNVPALPAPPAGLGMPGAAPAAEVPAPAPAGNLGDKYSVAFGFNQKYSNPFNPAIPNHRGVDLVIPGAKDNGRGTPFQAFQGGTVAAITKDPAGGNGIIIQTPDGIYNRYFHADKTLVKQGEQVEAGQDIGVLGASGTEGFPHLHFEVSKGINGDPQNALMDPRPYMNSAAAPMAAPATGFQQTPSGRLQYSDYDDLFMKYMPADLQADDRFRAIVASAAYAESGFDPMKKARGNEDSWGLFQMNRQGGAGTGYTAQQLQDPELQARVMVPQFAQAYRTLKGRYSNAEGGLTIDPTHFAALVMGMAEKPQGTDPNTGILAAGTAAYNNYVGAYGKITGPQQPGGARGQMADPLAGMLPSLPTTGFGGLAGALAYKGQLADAVAEALMTSDDPEQQQKIIQAFNARDAAVTSYMKIAQDVGDKNADLYFTQRGQDIQARGQDVTAIGNYLQHDIGLKNAATSAQGVENQWLLGLMDYGLKKDIATGYVGGQPTLEREQMAQRLGIDAGALTGEYEGQPTMAARTLEESIKQHQDTLRSGFADLTSRQAIAAEEAQRQSEVARAAMLRQALPPGTEYVPGLEPGGTGSRIAGMLGSSFSPTRYNPIYVDPGAGLAALNSAFSRAASAYPGQR